MKTIAITIDQPTLDRIDRLVAMESLKAKSRSEIVQRAVKEFVTRLERLAEDERERKIFRQGSSRLRRQAAALIKEQAKR